MASRVFNVDELATLTAIHLVEISPRSTVSLALTYRALEVPALSTLWGTQDSIRSFITHVLPEDIWRHVPARYGVELHPIPLTRLPTTAELNRLKRYAPWIRRLVVGMWSLPDAINKLFVPTSSDTQPFLHFTLQELNWRLNRSNAPFITAFLSPHLTKIDIAPDSSHGLASGLVDKLTGKPPIDAVSVLRAAIKMFPSSLRFLRIYLDIGPGACPTGLTEEISTFILRSGESLREFHSNLVLSPEAVIHLWNLPNLHAWTTEQIPPPITALIHDAIPGGHTSLLPSLRSLQLWDEAALEWLPLFDTTNDRYPPQSLVADNLSHLLYTHPTLVADSTLLSKFIPLINLVEITADLQCMQRGAGCASRFSDQDVECLALALPKLEVLKLGEAPCGINTCSTTILSLFFLSIHCASLKLLSIHFRTTNMVTDVMAMVDYAHSHDLHQRPKCTLGVLVAGNQIPPLEDYEFTLASMGISTIFPSLTRIQGSQDWGQLGHVVTMCGKVQESTNFMKFLNELRLSELSGEHLSSSSLERVERFLNEKVYSGHTDDDRLIFNSKS